MFFRYPSSYFMARQEALTTVMGGAQIALAELADYVADLKVESIKGAKAQEIRKKANAAADKFVAAKGQLVNEIKSLEGNPEKNKVLLGQLRKALAESEEATKRFKTLNIVLSTSDQAVINAVTSGHLSKTLRELQASIGKSQKAIDEVNAALGSGEAEKAGMVQINKLNVLQGKIHFFMYVYDPGKGPVQKEIKQGDTIPIHGMPIYIRVSVEDDMKTKFSKFVSGSFLPGGTHINDVSDATEGHKFSYTNEAVGTTTWVSKEEYTWEPDKITETSKKVRLLEQSSSDISTARDKGDIAKIWVDNVPTQNIGYEVTGKTIKWKRISLLNNKETIAEVVPENNLGRAYINFSVFE